MVYRIATREDNPLEDEPRQGLLLRDAVPRILNEHYKHTTRYNQAKYLGAEIIARDPFGTVEGITKAYLRTFAEDCRIKRKNGTETINIKLSFFSRMFEHFETELLGQYGSRTPGTFIKPDIPWVRKTKAERANALKWWLRPEMETKIIEWLRKNHEHDFADYIEFVTHSGTRVEEALRLQRQHFDFVNNLITIPGTKTDLSHRTVPMFAVSRDIAWRRLGQGDASTEYLFNLAAMEPNADDEVDDVVKRNYKILREKWNKVRFTFGLTRINTATIKALRRTFARYASDKGMPTQLLQQYLGHDQIETTIGYLKLIGGYNLDVMRQYTA